MTTEFERRYAEFEQAFDAIEARLGWRPDGVVMLVDPKTKQVFVYHSFQEHPGEMASMQEAEKVSRCGHNVISMAYLHRVAPQGSA